MNRKITIILIIFAVCLLIASPVCAKQKVKVKITTDVSVTKNKGYININLVDSHGKSIKSNGMINYTVSDENGNYKWTYKSYHGGVREKFDVGIYKVKVKFYGDSYYKKAKKTKKITVEGFDAYSYYDNHNWGLNGEVDDYIDYNYWHDEIYDDVDDPENEAWDI